MSFDPRSSSTRPPSLLGMLLSATIIGIVVGVAYFLLFSPSGGSGNQGPDLAAALASVGASGNTVTVSGGLRPERITIPAIGVDGPVLEMRIGPDGLWDANSIIGEVGHLQGTPLPGQEGNSVLAAHVTVPGGAYGPFKDLETLQAGNSVSIWTRNGTLYTFEVTGTNVVMATALEVIAPTPQPTLTLITCTGWDENQSTYLERFVVTARLLTIAPPT